MLFHIIFFFFYIFIFLKKFIFFFLKINNFFLKIEKNIKTKYNFFNLKNNNKKKFILLFYFKNFFKYNLLNKKKIKSIFLFDNKSNIIFLNFLKKKKKIFINKFFFFFKLNYFLINVCSVCSKSDFKYFIEKKFIFINKKICKLENFFLKKFDVIEFILNKYFFFYIKKNLFFLKNKKTKHLLLNLKNYYEIDILSFSIIILNFFKKNYLNYFIYYNFSIIWLNWIFWKNK